MNAISKAHQRAMSMRLLEGQRALVTGANSGIGEAVARGLAEAGAKVAVNYVVGDERAQAVVDDIVRSGGEAIAVRADVSKEDEVQSMFGRTIDAFGTFDQVFVLTRGGPGEATRLLSVFGYDTAFKFQQTGYAAALFLTMGLIILALALAAVRMLRRAGEP